MALEEGIGFEDGNVSESTSEASEQDQQRVRDDAKKAKQVRAQIQKSQQQNKQFAHMLALLLQLINDDILLGDIFQQLSDYHVPIPVIFLQFLPVIQENIDITVYQEIYQEIRATLPGDITLVSLVKWLVGVRKRSASLQKISKERYIDFIIHYLGWKKFINQDNMDEKTKSELRENIQKKL